jgi:hypothetical protein
MGANLVNPGNEVNWTAPVEPASRAVGRKKPRGHA